MPCIDDAFLLMGMLENKIENDSEPSVEDIELSLFGGQRDNIQEEEPSIGQKRASNEELDCESEVSIDNPPVPKPQSADVYSTLLIRF